MIDNIWFWVVLCYIISSILGVFKSRETMFFGGFIATLIAATQTKCPYSVILFSISGILLILAIVFRYKHSHKAKTEDTNAGIQPIISSKPSKKK